MGEKRAARAAELSAVVHPHRRMLSVSLAQQKKQVHLAGGEGSNLSAHTGSHPLLLRLALDIGIDLSSTKIAQERGYNGMPHDTTQHIWMLLACMLVHGC